MTAVSVSDFSENLFSMDEHIICSFELIHITTKIGITEIISEE